MSGYLLRYWEDAAAEQLPDYRRVAICALHSGDAIAFRTGHNTTKEFFPDLPKRFPNYDAAYTFVKERLNERAARGLAQRALSMEDVPPTERAAVA